GLINQLKSDGSAPKFVFVGPRQKVDDALQIMNAHGFSQIPVIEEGSSVGSIREATLMGKLLKNHDLIQAPVEDVMDKSFPVLREDLELESVVKHLKNSSAVLVEEYGRIVGIVTRHDIIGVQIRSI